MLKKWMLLCLCAVLLTGCSSATFETLGDEHDQQVAAPLPRNVTLELPQEAVQSVWASEVDRMYLCGDYTVYLQTMPSGDLAGSVRQLSGMDIQKLTVLTSSCEDHQRYEWVWVAAGEGCDAVYRCVLLDDGNFHYALTLTADSFTVGSMNEAWNGILSSFCLEELQ